MEPITTIPVFARLEDYVGVWAIEQHRGETMWRWSQSANLVEHMAHYAQRQAFTEDADEKTPTRKAEDPPYQTTKSGNVDIAVINLTGTLMKSESSYSSGGSTVRARRLIRHASNNPNIGAILIQIESPGGTVAGTMDLAQDVAAADKLKPVFAQVDDLCASAAYWVASQCRAIFANNETALVGSIGTLMTVYDVSKAAENEGVKTLVFATGTLKGAATPGAPITDEQQAYFQGLVDDAQRSFDAAIKRGRGMSDSQLTKVRTGGVFGASEALSLKLIDGIQAVDKTVSQLATEARRSARKTERGVAAPAPNQGRKMEETILADGTPGTTVVVAADPVAEQITRSRQALAAEMNRCAAIQKVCAAYPTIAAKAIADGWTAEKAELEALRASLNDTPAANGGGIITGASKWKMGREAAPGVSVNQAIEAGIRMSFGNNVEKEYRPEVMEAAHDNFRNIGLQELFILAAFQNGFSGRPGARISQSNIREVMQYAFGQGPDRMAGGSTISMSGILGAVANKEILAGYLEEDNTWRAIAQIKSVSNFQQHTSYRMLDNLEFEELGPDGKMKHGTLGQESYTRQVKTYAKILAMTFQQIVNDDMSALADLRPRIGRGYSRKLSKVFWTVFIAAINAGTFFTSGRTNYITGATTNLGTDGVGLGLGVKAFRKMTSPNGTAPGSADGAKHINADTQNPVGENPGGRPEILLVSPELEGNAEVLYRNQNLGTVKNSDANIYQNKYRPVVAWQLSDSSYTGYSTTHWGLFNNPQFMAPMVVSFLGGQQTPTIESAEADFDELGVKLRGFHHFGCDLAEYLAGVWSKGAA